MLLLHRIIGTALILILSVVGLKAQTFECDGRFLISFHESQGISAIDGTGIHRVDYGEGTVAFIDPVSFPDIKLNGIGYNQVDQFVYGISPVSSTNDQHDIVRLYSDGSYQVLEIGEGAIENINWYYAAADFSPDGYLVVHDRRTQQLHYLDVAGDEVILHASITLRWAPELAMQRFFVAMTDFAFEIGGSSTIYSHQRNDYYPQEAASTQGALLKINGDWSSPDAGVVSVVGNVDSDVIAHLGSLFFSATGGLYGYGSLEPKSGDFDQNRLVAINKTNGEAELIAEGPSAASTDGCSCPSTVAIQMQSLLPTDPCQNTLAFDIKVINNSYEAVEGILLTDTLPEGLIIDSISISENISYDLDEDTGVGFGVLTLRDLTLSAGEHTSLTIYVSHYGIAGNLENQAYLMNLPSALGSFVASDDITTPTPYDPTQVSITHNHPLPILAKDTTVCADDIVTLTTTEEINLPFYWTGPNNFYSEETSPEIVLSTEPQSVYYLHRQTANCESIDSILVITSASPDLEIISDTTINAGDSISLALRATSSAQFVYQWTPSEGLSCTDCLNPRASPTETTVYQLTAQSAFGCTQTTSVKVEVADLEPAVERVSIPNAFSPNGDGVNDVFFPVANQDITCQSLEIYNRWGELVFKQADFPPNNEMYGWEGRYNGRLTSSGTYTYRLIVTDREEVSRTYVGKLRLIE